MAEGRTTVEFARLCRRWCIVLAVVGGAGATSAQSQVFERIVELALLRGGTGYRVDGINATDKSGSSVTALGDINDDGIDDFAIGAPLAAPFGKTEAGEAYVIFGGADVGVSGTIELSTLDGTNGFVLIGDAKFDKAGTSVAGLGDVNGDGIADMAVGAPFADPDGRVSAGRTYVIFGGAGIGSTGSIDLASLDGTNGFVINGADTEDRSGAWVSSAGDLNDDSIVDLAIGAEGGDPNGRSAAGEVFVVFGAPDLGQGGVVELSSLNGAIGFVIQGAAELDATGVGVSAVGDVNGDQIDDLLVGAHKADPGGRLAAGKAYVVLGSSDIGSQGPIDLAEPASAFSIHGIAAGDIAGRSVASAGDLNDDGINDLLIGARRADPGGVSRAGQAYVVFGSLNLTSGGSLELSSLNGTNGFTINGLNPVDEFGNAVAHAGDLNNDGIADLIVAAALADGRRTIGVGQSYVIFGAPDVGADGIFELPSLTGANGFAVNGIKQFDAAGSSVSRVGDINDDGIDDLILGAIGADPGGRVSAGSSFIIFGGRDLLALSLDVGTMERGARSVLQVVGARPGERVDVIASLTGTGRRFVPLLGIKLDLAFPFVKVGHGPADANGEYLLRFWVSRNAPLGPVWFQAAAVRFDGSVKSRVHEGEIIEN